MIGARGDSYCWLCAYRILEDCVLLHQVGYLKWFSDAEKQTLMWQTNRVLYEVSCNGLSLRKNCTSKLGHSETVLYYNTEKLRSWPFTHILASHNAEIRGK